MRARPRFIPVLDHVRRVRPDLGDVTSLIDQRRLIVGGSVVTSASSLVRNDAPVVVRRRTQLRGEAKLRTALDEFRIDVTGRVCLDLGASAGGFTRVLLSAGAGRVFAVDVGFGQLLGELRTDPRVVALERTNLADVHNRLEGGTSIEVVTMDLSYLSIADAVPQLESLRFAPHADLIALVKPHFELGLGRLPTGRDAVAAAHDRAVEGVEREGRWHVVGTTSPAVSGRRGAVESFLHARRG